MKSWLMGIAVLGLASGLMLTSSAKGQAPGGVKMEAPAAAGTITGTVTGPDGKPAANSPVKVLKTQIEQISQGGKGVGMQGAPKRPGNDAVAETTTDANGSYTLSNVPPGVYRLVAGVPFREQAMANVTVQAGQTVTVNLKLRGRRFNS